MIIRLVVFAVVMSLTINHQLLRADWPQFLGPQRNGIIQAGSLVAEWPDGGPAELWRVRGGVGMSGISVSGNSVVTMWNAKEGQVVVSLATVTGKPNWTTRVGPIYENAMGDGPRATPTIANEKVYALTGEGILVCLDLADGNVHWEQNLVAANGGDSAEYGMSCSPLVVDDLVVVQVGAPKATVVAVNASTGKQKWASGEGPAAYSSPSLLNVAGELQIVAFTGQGVSGIRIVDGQRLWHYPFKTAYDCNTATPIQANDNIFISAGENHGCVMLSVTKNADTYEVTEAWESTQTKSVMRNEWQTSVLVDGHLYGFDNVGSAGPVTHLTCVNALTGETVWRENRFGKANLVAANGVLWITTMKGDFVMAKATTKGYVELGRKRLIGKTRQAPAIDQGKAFLRDDMEVVCLKID